MEWFRAKHGVTLIRKKASCGMATPRGRAAYVMGILAAVLGLSIILPSAPHGPFFCLFRFITGLPCPSCGMTRAFIALGHGDVKSAFFLNPASPLIYCTAWLTLGLAGIQAAMNREILLSIWNRIRKPSLPVVLVIMGLAWIFNLVRHFSLIP